MRTIHADLIAEKNKLDSSGAWLRLLDVMVNTALSVKLAHSPVPVVFAGETFAAFGFQVQEATVDSKGGLADLEITVSNVTREMSAFVEANDLRGNSIRYRAVHSDHLSSADMAAFDESYEIDSYEVTQETCSFHLSHQQLLQFTFPARRAVRNHCQHRYKKATECGFADHVHLGVARLTSVGTLVTINGPGDFTQLFVSGDTIIADGQTRIVTVVITDFSLSVTVAPSPPWDHEFYTVGKATCTQVLEGNNGCRAHFGATGPGRFGGFVGMPGDGGRFFT